MSTKTDRIAAAAALAAMQGAYTDRQTTKELEASLVRQEALSRLNNSISRDNSPSGWVDKQTGRPILNMELEQIPPDSRITSADFQLQQMERAYKSEYAWTQGERDEQRRNTKEDQAAAREVYLLDLQEGREHDSKTWKERTDYNNRIYQDRQGGKGAETTEKGKLTDKQYYDMESKLFQQYKESGAGESREEGGFLGFGKDTIDGQGFNDWVMENASPSFRQIYSERYGRRQPEQGGETETETKAAPGKKDDSVAKMIDGLRGSGKKEEAPIETQIKPKTVQPPPTSPEQGEQGLLSRKIDEWRDMPQEQKTSAKEKRELERQKSFILKNMSPQQKQKYAAMSDEEKEQYLLSLIRQNKR